MTFSAVFQFRPGDEQGKGRWLLEHFVEHRLIVGALLAQTPPFSAVDLPIQTMEDSKKWLAAHQQMSQSAWTGIGGGQSTDFGDVNWENETQVLDWHRLHYLWHQAVHDALSL